MILAILQARTSSSRLPGKVLKKILNKPMLVYQIERIKRAKNMDKLVVATSVERSDDPIAAICKDMDVDCFRGSLGDVLDRFYQAMRRYQPEHVVRLTGDCPLTDPSIVEQTIGYHAQGNYDYTSNALLQSFPHGLDVEVVRASVLEIAWIEAVAPSQREHVTSFIYENPQRFKLGNFANNEDLAHLRWTVDYLEDFELIKIIYEMLYPSNGRFLTEDILSLLKKYPELGSINAKYCCSHKQK